MQSDASRVGPMEVYHGVDCTRIAVDSRFQGMEAEPNRVESFWDWEGNTISGVLQNTSPRIDCPKL
jgi:hypothetical protein